MDEHQAYLCKFFGGMVFLLHERKEMGTDVKFCDIFFNDLHQI